MNLFSRGRRAPTPAPDPVHASHNPLFTDGSEAAATRQLIYLWTAGVLVVLAALWWVFGPWSRITSVQVRGTVFVTASSVHDATEYELSQRRFGVFPGRQRVFFSRGSLATRLKARIERRISIRGVQVDWVDRRTISVTVQERLPLGMWSNGTQSGWIDAEGKIVSLDAAPENLHLWPIEDEGALPFVVNDQVVDPGVVTAISTLHDQFILRHIDIATYILPLPQCIESPVVTEEVTTNTNVNVNGNGLRNMNATDNTNSASKAPTEIPCQAESLRLQRPEIQVQVKDGPLVRFDRYTNLVSAVSALERLLAEEAYGKAKTIDLRFGERAFIH